MNYIPVTESTEWEDIGWSYPQVCDMTNEKYHEGKDSVYNMPHRDFPDFTPNLRHLKLNWKALASDVVSCVYISNGFLVSKKVKSILEKFNLPEHRFYPANLYQFEGLIKRSYYWFYYFFSLEEYVKLDESIFYETETLFDGKLRIDIPITNMEEYEYQKCYIENKPPKSIIDRTRRKLVIEKLVFDQVDCHYDVTRITPFSISQLFSKRLFNALQENKITGLVEYTGRTFCPELEVRFRS